MTIPAPPRHPAKLMSMAIAGAVVAILCSVAYRVPGASAAGVNAGAAEVVTPSLNENGTPSANGNAPLSSGGSATRFSLKLPMGAACKGDSANGNYRIQSYMVPASVDPSTLSFDNTGPTSPGFSEPLYDLGGSPYINVQTANADTPGGPGLIVNIPALSYFVYEPPPSKFAIPPGTYNIGIACTLGLVGPGQLEKFWNVRKTFTADAADKPAAVKWAVAAAAAPTTTTLAASPSAGAAVGADVTLTATVSPADSAGAVTFKDGDTVLNSTPVPVSNGKATYTTKTLKAGSHKLTASFTPSSDTLGLSTSAALDFAITDATQPTASSSSSLSSSTPGGGSGSGSGTGTGAGTGGATAATANAGGQLAKTGTSPIVALSWAFLLICTGRAVVLLCRRPTVRTRSSR